MLWSETPVRASVRSTGRRRLLGALGTLAGATMLGAGLSGCGFRLRRPPDLAFRRVALVQFSARSGMAAALRAAMRSNLEVVGDPRQADVVVVAIHEQRLRSIVASGAAGQVRELQLRLQFSYKVQSAQGQELLSPVEMALSRDMSYAEAFALAKAAEEEQLVREMQEDMALQVMRRLATLKL